MWGPRFGCLYEFSDEFSSVVRKVDGKIQRQAGASGDQPRPGNHQSEQVNPVPSPDNSWVRVCIILMLWILRQHLNDAHEPALIVTRTSKVLASFVTTYLLYNRVTNKYIARDGEQGDTCAALVLHCCCLSVDVQMLTCGHNLFNFLSAAVHVVCLLGCVWQLWLGWKSRMM